MSSKKHIANDEKLENQEFELFKALEAIDRKKYDYYETLTEEQKNKFVPYLLLQWVSSIKNSGALAAYYLMSTNSYANQYMFNETIQKHPDLQWKMLCATSPNMGKQFHQWIPQLPARAGNFRQALANKEVLDYFRKTHINVDDKILEQCSIQFVNSHKNKCRLAEIYPTSKLEDIELLSTIVSEEEMNEYQKELGTY